MGVVVFAMIFIAANAERTSCISEPKLMYRLTAFRRREAVVFFCFRVADVRFVRPARSRFAGRRRLFLTTRIIFVTVLLSFFFPSSSAHFFPDNYVIDSSIYSYMTASFDCLLFQSLARQARWLRVAPELKESTSFAGWNVWKGGYFYRFLVFIYL